MTGKTTPEGTIKRRPAANAIVKVAELGLVPIRPPAAVAAPPDDQIGYLPPERVDTATYTVRGDLYGLGATLYYLLTGRPPFAGSTPDEALRKIRTVAPAPLSTLRPELAPEFAALVHQLLAKRPEDRPRTAWDVEVALARFGRPGTAPAPAATTAPAQALIPVTEPEAQAEIPEAELAPSDEWGAESAFSTAHAQAGPVQRKPRTAQEKSRTRMLLILGLCLHMTAVGIVIAWVTGVFRSSKEPDPRPAPTQPEKPPKKGTRTGNVKSSLLDGPHWR
jgi:serine/threonine protein kinase